MELSRVVMLAAAAFCGTFAHAEDTVLKCVEDKSAEIKWQAGSVVGAGKMVVERHVDPSEPVHISFIIQNHGATLIANAGKAQLKKLSEDVYIESGANPIIWTLLPGRDSIPNYLIVHKAFTWSTGPYSISLAYRCE